MRALGSEPLAPKLHRAGTHRTRSPAQTLAAYMPRMHELGVTRLADVTGLDHVGLPVYMAVRPNARSLSVSQGKGVDRDAAKASALMEAIEGWHAEHVELPVRYESPAALRRAGEVVLDVTRLQLHPGAALRDEAPIAWVRGHELIADRPCWVPFECVTANCVPTPGAAPLFGASSNGLASGNHLLEAIVHGLCEVLERDACSRAVPREQARQLDLSTVREPSAIACWSACSGPSSSSRCGRPPPQSASRRSRASCSTVRTVRVGRSTASSPGRAVTSIRTWRCCGR